MNLAESIQRAIVTHTLHPGGATAELRFAVDDFFFEGHFPEQAVLPAVVQLGSAVALASRALGARYRLAEVTRAKFTNPTGPGRLLKVALSIEPEADGRQKVRVVISDGEAQVSELVLRVVPA